MKNITHKILWSTIEDFVGIWEINWEINSLLLDNTTTQNKEIAKKILLYFLETELINFYFSKWGSNEIKRIDKLEAIQIIKKEKFWNAPNLNEVCVKVGSTQKGEDYYNRELVEDIAF